MCPALESSGCHSGEKDKYSTDDCTSADVATVQRTIAITRGRRLVDATLRRLVSTSTECGVRLSSSRSRSRRLIIWDGISVSLHISGGCPISLDLEDGRGVVDLRMV